MNQHFITMTAKDIEDDTEGCMQCMFQSEVRGHCLQSSYLYNDDHCREVRHRQIQTLLFLWQVRWVDRAD